MSSRPNIGTAILLKPGIIAGGTVVHDCPLSRSIGYFLEPVVMLAPFSKKPLHLTLRGITSDDRDLSVSTTMLPCHHPLTLFVGRPRSDCHPTPYSVVRSVRRPGASGAWAYLCFPSHYPNFPQIKKRGSPPLGGGEVQFLCPIVKQVKTINFVELGKIKRIRGIA